MCQTIIAGNLSNISFDLFLYRGNNVTQPNILVNSSVHAISHAHGWGFLFQLFTGNVNTEKLKNKFYPCLMPLVCLFCLFF